MSDIRQGICPSCDHDEIIEGIPLDFGAAGTSILRPLAVTHARRGLWSWAASVGGFKPDKPVGPMRVFVCRRCGLTQWFTDKPDEIPIGHEHLTRIIKGNRGDPYR
jgi:hypothetical protein